MHTFPFCPFRILELIFKNYKKNKIQCDHIIRASHLNAAQLDTKPCFRPITSATEAPTTQSRSQCASSVWPGWSMRYRGDPLEGVLAPCAGRMGSLNQTSPHPTTRSRINSDEPQCSITLPLFEPQILKHIKH